MSFIYGDEYKKGSTPLSSNSYARGDNQNSGNVITDRPSVKLHHAPGGASSICFGAGEEVPPQQQYGENRQPERYEEPPPQQYQREPQEGGSMEPAGETYYKQLMLPELRVLCRERGLNPGGGKEALLERLKEAIGQGAQPIMVRSSNSDDREMSANSYARPDGQNTGNYMTDRNSSRVLQPPGGGSSFSFGNQ